MLNNIPPKLWRWGSIALIAVGLIWLAFNPQYLFEDQQRSPDTGTTAQSIPTNSTKAKTTQAGQKADFDFYVLALSWSPSYCASSNRTTGLQCGGKRFFSFVVHGLWPQYEKSWPSFCDERAKKVPDGLARSMLDIMPGFALIQNQWKKHGTCSGLAQNAYFNKIRAAYDLIRFPARYRLNSGYLSVTPQSVEEAFRTENPGIAADAIAVTCGKRRLSEVRICFSKGLKFRSCRQVDQKSCRKSKVIMPPVREG